MEKRVILQAFLKLEYTRLGVKGRSDCEQKGYDFIHGKKK